MDDGDDNDRMSSLVRVRSQDFHYFGDNYLRDSLPFGRFPMMGNPCSEFNF